MSIELWWPGSPRVFRASLMTQQVKNLPAMWKRQETQVWSLGREDPLEERMASHSSILAWKIPRIEEPGGLLSSVLQRVSHDWSDWTHTYTHARTHTHTHTHTHIKSTYGWQAFGFWIMLYNSDKYSCHYFIRIHLFYSSPTAHIKIPFKT